MTQNKGSGGTVGKLLQGAANGARVGVVSRVVQIKREAGPPHNGDGPSVTGKGGGGKRAGKLNTRRWTGAHTQLPIHYGDYSKNGRTQVGNVKKGGTQLKESNSEQGPPVVSSKVLGERQKGVWTER